MASDASDTDDLPSVDDQLLQAINILWLCSKADEDCEEFDLSYPMWAAVSLLEDLVEAVGHDHESKIIQAESIVKAAAVTHDNTDGDIGAHGFDLTWPLFAAIRLIQEVIDERAKRAGKKRRPRPKKSMREISTVDPEHARAFHRLLKAAGKLPVGALERLARYAEVELTDEKPRRARADAAKPADSTEPAPELRP